MNYEIEETNRAYFQRNKEASLAETVANSPVLQKAIVGGSVLGAGALGAGIIGGSAYLGAAIPQALLRSGIRNQEDHNRIMNTNPQNVSGWDKFVSDHPHVSNLVTSPVPFFNVMNMGQAGSSAYAKFKENNDPGVLGTTRFAVRNPIISNWLRLPFLGGANRPAAGLAVAEQDLKDKGFAYRNPMTASLFRQYYMGPTAAHTAAAKVRWEKKKEQGAV